jgi:alanyl aminopeptidase
MKALLDGHSRLDQSLRPSAYRLRLHVDPSAARYEGQVEIECLDMAEREAAREAFDLHAEGLQIASATWRAGAEAHLLTALQGPNGALRLSASAPLPRAQAFTLTLDFSGPLDEVPEGVYRVCEGDAWYVFTQFEPLSARRCFPCFDEPDFKAPFTLTLAVPPSCTAAANAPTSRKDAFTERDVHLFAETPPIATYLVAFAVGPFDVVEAPEVPGVDDVPLRVLTTRGRGHLAAYALERTPQLLRALARWFGQPYPYDKLDLVGVPNFAAGAMENVGLVTFRERLVLLDAEAAPANDRLWAQIVIAHELAHMWFGNLVTMRWWDDLWLNEAFATWMEMECVAEVDPSVDARMEAVAETLRVMDHDALVEARAIRQPIVDGGDVLNAFDGITYSKGAGVVRMIEAWLGADAFQAGVRAYLRDHAHANAVTADLVDALTRASGEPVGPVLASWLDQPGLPLVTARLVQDGAAVELTQRRYLPDDAASTAAWQIPICLRFGADDNAQGSVVRYLLDAPRKVYELPPGPRATWLHPNAGEVGYFHWAVEPDALRALVGPRLASLSVAERLGLVEHLGALSESGALPAEDHLHALARLATDAHRLVVAAVCASVRKLHRLVAAPATLAALSAWIERHLSAHYERLGLTPRVDDDAATRLLRPVVLQTIAETFPGHPVHGQARVQALSLLHNASAADPEHAQSVLPIAALSADSALIDALVVALRTAPTPAHRAAALSALGQVPTPAMVAHVLDLFLTDTLRAQDFFGVVRPMRRREDTLEAAWVWIEGHWTQASAKLGDEACAHLPSLVAASANPSLAARVEAFFENPARRKPGVERHVRQAREEVARRARWAARAEVELSLALRIP